MSEGPSVETLQDQVIDAGLPRRPACRCGGRMILDRVETEGQGTWLIPVWTCRRKNCPRSLYAQVGSEDGEVVQVEWEDEKRQQRDRFRRSYPTHIMQRVAGPQPPNFILNGLVQNHTISDVTRSCDYCPDSVEEKPRMELVRLPNGCYICLDHPSAPERDVFS